MTELLSKAFAELSKLPIERQDELAKMLLEVAESDRRSVASAHQLTPGQQAEVDAAIKEDRWLEGQELERFFESLLK